jgi:beta-lactamase superfamily II metal-dependent hydrolase
MEYDTYIFESFMSLAQEQEAKIEVPYPGTVYTAGGLTVTVLGPVGSNYEDLNDTSLVLMVQFGEKKFLFTGDMEAFAENELLSSNISLKADVLKVGHHGSYSSTSAAFLKAVDPDYAVISCSKDNEYGHPHRGPMENLESLNVEIYRTDYMGTVMVMTDGKTLTFYTEKSAAMPAAA